MGVDLYPPFATDAWNEGFMDFVLTVGDYSS